MQNSDEILKKHKGKKLLDGIAASPGLATGVVRIIDEHEIAQTEPGEVIVADKLRPDDLYHKMEDASAFVTDTGGLTSYAANFARGNGKPAVTTAVNQNGLTATQVLKNGVGVIVDGTEGAVYQYV
ncbi:PEP-utilizing enzyme [Chloroflexota bacterium]